MSKKEEKSEYKRRMEAVDFAVSKRGRYIISYALYIILELELLDIGRRVIDPSVLEDIEYLYDHVYTLHKEGKYHARTTNKNGAQDKE